MASGLLAVIYTKPKAAENHCAKRQCLVFGMMPVGEPQSRSWRFAETQKCLPMPEIKPGFIGRPVRNLASILTEFVPIDRISMRVILRWIFRSGMWGYGLDRAGSG